MKFTEFVNKQKNLVTAGSVRKIDSSIAISEERQQFFSAGFKKNDIVESAGIVYTVLEKRSNYYTVVDSVGTVSRMFPGALSASTALVESTGLYRGYTPKAPEFKAEEFADMIAGCGDDIAVLRAIKAVDSYLMGESTLEQAKTLVDKTGFTIVSLDEQEYKPKDKMTIAMIIADACGFSHEGATNAESLVNQAIRKAAKNPTMLKNKELVQNMLKIATDVGIKYNPSVFDKLDEAELNEDPLNAWKNRMMRSGADSFSDEDDNKKDSFERHIHAFKKDATKPGIFKKVGSFDRSSKKEVMINETIVKTTSGYRLVSSSGKNLGDFDSKEAAEKHEREVEYFKHMDESTHKVGDTVWAIHPKERYKVLTGKIVISNKSTAVVQHRDGTKASYPHSDLSTKFPLENPYRTNESDESGYDTETQAMGYAALKRHLSKMSGVKDHEPIADTHDADGKEAKETEQEVPASRSELPHGHTMSPTDNTNRIQKIRKIRGDH